MEALKILCKARSKLTPEIWGKGRRNYDRPLDTCCIAEAVEESAPADAERKRAVRALYDAAGLEWSYEKITEWNDAPERTYHDITKTLDLAIAILRLR
jgi:hypothetical protein